MTTDPLTLVRKTVNEYWPGSDVHNAPGRVTILNSSSSCLSDQHFLYDSNSSYAATPTAGLLKKIHQPINSCSTNNATNNGSWMITEMAYDSYGNQTQVKTLGATSAEDVTVDTTYDTTYKLFPITQKLSGNTAYQESVLYYGANGLALTDSKAFWGAVCCNGRRATSWDI